MSLEQIPIPGKGLGALLVDSGPGGKICDFLVWAPYARQVDLCLDHGRGLTMEGRENGYFTARLDPLPPDCLYRYRLHPRADAGRAADTVMRADPASRHQPAGINGPSRVDDDLFDWTDVAWTGRCLDDYIIYEVHVGTATTQGTLAALIAMLPDLRDLGVTALELMPVAEFPGERNWGYDGVFPFAAHHGYGGPLGLKRLVDACHSQGLAVIMDVVYNHLGPEGNYLADFGPYFTDTYTSPWGQAINFDGAYSDPVRRFFLENARYWIRDCHLDALRVDAVHGIFDFSAQPFLGELTKLVGDLSRQLKRRIYCIAESDRNDVQVIRRRQSGGLGFDAQWNDDFHHALHALITGEQHGYYADFGALDDLAKAWQCGFVYDGCYSHYRQRRHGNSADRQPPDKLVVFSQNHDQVGNRINGERLTGLVDLQRRKLAAVCTLLSPYIPLIFMGEEYGETAPFAYFISHTDPALVEAVRRGRKHEFSAFGWQIDPPDPQDEATFLRAKLNPALGRQPGEHAVTLALYRRLLDLRKNIPAVSHGPHRKMQIMTDQQGRLLQIIRHHGDSAVFMALYFASAPGVRTVQIPSGNWIKRFDSAEKAWLGPGSRIGDLSDHTATQPMALLPWQAVVWEKDPS